MTPGILKRCFRFILALLSIIVLLSPAHSSTDMNSYSHSSYGKKKMTEWTNNVPDFLVQYDGYYIAAFDPTDIYLVLGTYPTDVPSLGVLYMAFHAQSITEREYVPSTNCKVPNRTASPYIPPQDPLSNDTINFAPLLSYVNLTDLVWTSRTATETFSGTNVSHTIFETTDPVSGVFLQTNLSVTYGNNYSYPYSTDTTYTYGDVMMITYRPDAVKVSSVIRGYPFTQDNNTFLICNGIFELGTVGNATITFVQVNETQSMNMMTEDGKQLVYDVEAFYVRDGTPYLMALNFSKTFSLPESAIFSLHLGYAYCSTSFPNDAFETLFWDPLFYGLGLAFSPPIEPPGTPPNSPAAKSRTGMIVAVTVSLVVVAIAVTLIVMLWIFYPPFKGLIYGVKPHNGIYSF